MKLLDIIKNAFRAENRIFRLLKSCDDGMKFLIIKEMLLQFFPTWHLHRNRKKGA